MATSLQRPLSSVHKEAACGEFQLYTPCDVGLKHRRQKYLKSTILTKYYPEAIFMLPWIHI